MDPSAFAEIAARLTAEPRTVDRATLERQLVESFQHVLDERERVERSRRLDALRTMTSGFAHELRNPLNGAQLHLSWLARSLESPSPDVRETIATIAGELQRLGRLVTDFLAYAEPRPTNRTATNVQRIVSLALDLAGTAPGCALHVEPIANEVAVLGDEASLARALANLLANACEAARSRVVVRAVVEPGAVRIEVEDDGAGIAAPARIYEPFYTTKPNGTGLGLSIVHRIVADHGGSIDADSSGGRTRFRMRIPSA